MNLFWYSDTFNSDHPPKQCKNDIPFTLAGLISTIVEISEVRKKRLDELQKVFYFHKYSQNVIQETVWKATVVPIENLRASRAKTDINNFAFVTAFNPITKRFSQ